ncbi:MAG TPA: Gfo/Idh/MocA family oxidoreductase [Verrucomicrobiae bacterium]|nr:Gfo/Idh/MocA family oxidoreductase [Verrucomicrobiae bacterium]
MHLVFPSVRVIASTCAGFFRLFLAGALLCSAGLSQALAADKTVPVRVGIIGLTHDHGFGFIPRLRNRPDVELAGIVETNRGLVEAYASNLQLDTNLFFSSVAAMQGKSRVDAVAVFTSTFDHKRVVEECVGRGIRSVMVEKPLAVNFEHARAIAEIAGRHEAEVIVNYETTWYPVHLAAFKLAVTDRALGTLRKIVAHHGHPGPTEIGCTEDFVSWLADPVLNGGGALTDFGCYGAVLMTWLLEGKRPTSVFAVAQQFKPDVYPKVEDEATIVLTYPGTQGIIQASWNWPYDRKDLEIYGARGYLMLPNSTTLRGRVRGAPEKQLDVPPLTAPEADPVSYLAAIARREIKPSGMSSLEYNLVVMEILDAARRSIREGRRVDLPTN